jgi:hypothetical protein
MYLVQLSSVVQPCKRETRPSDFNRTAPGENAFTLQKNACPINPFYKSHLLLGGNGALAGRSAMPDASPPSARRPALVLRPPPRLPAPSASRSLRPTAHAGPLPFAGGCLRCLLISLRPPAPRLSGPPPRLTPPPPCA